MDAVIRRCYANYADARLGDSQPNSGIIHILMSIVITKAAERRPVPSIKRFPCRLASTDFPEKPTASPPWAFSCLAIRRPAGLGRT